MKLKKAVAFALIVATVLTCASAKSKKKKKSAEWWNSYGGGVEQGNFIVNVGAGLNGNIGKEDMSWYFPPLEATVEYTVKIGELPFGFGGFIGHSGYGQERTVSGYDYSFERHATYFGALAAYHVNFTDMFDIYASTKLGVDIHAEKKEGYAFISDGMGGIVPKKYSDDDTSAIFFWALNAGATWYFSDVFGLNVEVGGPTFVKIGASFKF